MRREGGLDPIFDLSSFLKRNAIFVHVPKAAGRSVRKGLFDGRTASHTTMYHYQLAFSRLEFRRMFKFAFVRNPWDRCYSAYRFLMQGGVNEWNRRDAERHLSPYGSFENFILKGLGKPAVMGIVHFLPACHFIEVRPGTMSLDFLGYYESFEEDFAYVAKRMGNSSVSAPWENKTPGENAGYRDVYTPAMIDSVAQVYERDIQLFGYSFDHYRPHLLNRKK